MAPSVALRLLAATAGLVAAVSAAVVCPTGYTAGTTQCIESWSSRCYLGYTWTGTQCIAKTCPTGQVWQRTVCATAVCPSGYIYSSTAKQCTTASTTCTAGRVWSATLGKCICPTGTIWSTSLARCVTGTCPAGYLRDSAGVCYDKNECATAGICGCCGTCVNTVGSFQCRCGTITQSTPCSCPARVRKEWRSLTLTEKDRFRNAIKALIAQGKYRTIASYHEQGLVQTYGHESNGFLAWHRWFTYLFENQLRSLGGSYACMTIPYWDWTADVKSNTLAVPYISVVQEMGGTGSTCILDSFFGYYRYPTNQCVRRPFTLGWAPPRGIEVASGITNNAYFNAYSELLKGWHGYIHDYIGATMSDGLYSPMDPIFWLHHANVDRLWYQWQKCKGYQGTPPATVPSAWYSTNSVPVSHGFDVRMPVFPTSVTPRSVNSIRTLGYSYAKSSYTGTWDIDNICTTARRRRQALDNTTTTSNTTVSSSAIPPAVPTSLPTPPTTTIAAPAAAPAPAATNANNNNNNNTNNGNNNNNNNGQDKGLALALGKLGKPDPSKDSNENSAREFAASKTSQMLTLQLSVPAPPPGAQSGEFGQPTTLIGQKLAGGAELECAFWGKRKPLSPMWAKMLGISGKRLPCQE